MRRQGLELVDRRREGKPGKLRHRAGEAHGKLRMGVEAGTDSGAALRQSQEPRQTRLDAVDAELDLAAVGTELLAKGEGGCVLQVRAADLDDPAEPGRLGR